MNLIQSWLTANKLTLNVKKTKYMLIGSKFNLSQIHNDFTVKVHNTPLARVNKHKYVGVHIDEFLNWRPHINATSKKISAGLAILKRVSTNNALVMPYFNYCSTVWGNIGKGLSDKFQNLQNGAARILTFSNYETRSSILLDELGWERLENISHKQLAMMVFTNTSNVHAHNLRNSEINCCVPRPRTEYAKGSLHYRGSVLWNKIPSEIRHMPSLKVFQ